MSYRSAPSASKGTCLRRFRAPFPPDRRRTTDGRVLEESGGPDSQRTLRTCLAADHQGEYFAASVVAIIVAIFAVGTRWRCLQMPKLRSPVHGRSVWRSKSGCGHTRSGTCASRAGTGRRGTNGEAPTRRHKNLNRTWALGPCRRPQEAGRRATKSLPLSRPPARASRKPLCPLPLRLLLPLQLLLPLLPPLFHPPLRQQQDGSILKNSRRC